MQVRDLTESFIAHVLAGGNVPAYEASFPELFEHYFRFFAPARGYASDLTPEKVREHRDLVRRELPALLAAFDAADLDLTLIDIVLLVGAGSSNGHAFEHSGRIIVWLPVETYRSALSVRVFACHELVHALHYRDSPSFGFDDLQGRNHLGRQLLTEGLATLLTQKLLGVDDATALWADCVPRGWAETWLARRTEHLAALAAYALEGFNTAPEDNGFFWYTGAADGELHRNRSGYLLGMKVVEAVAGCTGLAPADLLRLERPRMETIARAILHDMTLPL